MTLHSVCQIGVCGLLMTWFWNFGVVRVSRAWVMLYTRHVCVCDITLAAPARDLFFDYPNGPVRVPFGGWRGTGRDYTGTASGEI